MATLKNSFSGIIIYIMIVIFLFHCGCCKDTGTSLDEPISVDKGYPRLAMWWPDTWGGQSLDELKRYDWIGFGAWDNLSTIAKLKALNPDQKHFMDYSITETSWSDWQHNKTVMEKIPSQWFLTQRGTLLAQPLDVTQTTVAVEAVVDNNGTLLFEIDDNITCEFETMKVKSVDEQNKTLTVDRGFIRSEASHPKGARIAPHITFWPESWVMNMSTLCPKVDINDGNGPQTWIDFACRYLGVKDTDKWDGYIVDRVEADQSWLIPWWCRSIDPDCSNKQVTDDYDGFDAAWYEGCAGFLEYLRSIFPDKVIISNTSGYYYQQLNGAIYEGFPGNWDNDKPVTYEEWSERALGEHGYINVSRVGYAPNYSLVETYEDEEGPKEGDLTYDNPYDQPGFVPNYQKMRFGLTTALLGDGYFSYEINTNGHGSLGLMWFDEYDNAGRGRNYLGMPIGYARKLMSAGDGYVWKREYENGLVICNPTNVSVTVALNRSYHLIEGNQAPEINSGEPVSKITIQPRDGRILLNE